MSESVEMESSASPTTKESTNTGDFSTNRLEQMETEDAVDDVETKASAMTKAASSGNSDCFEGEGNGSVAAGTTDASENRGISDGGQGSLLSEDPSNSDCDAVLSGQEIESDKRFDSSCTVLIRGQKMTKPIRGVVDTSAPTAPQAAPRPLPAVVQNIQDPIPDDVPKRETEREGLVLGGCVSYRNDAKLFIHPSSDFVLLDFVQHYIARELNFIQRKPSSKVFCEKWNSLFYRCHIVTETSSSATVQLIDYGDVVEIPRKPSNLLPLNVLTIPPLAVPVEIGNLADEIKKGTFVNVRLTSVSDGVWKGQLL